MKKTKTRGINVTLDIDVVDYIDAYRGLITRSSFINSILRDWMDYDQAFSQARGVEDDQ